ncbi:MAG: hypothetical protein GEV12_17315 [Micromonosporaceae bacterium]|nr:hypothetical protein [Micromonosporaceae bacterium]
MDVFSRTFLPATSEAGLPIPVVSRHMSMLRRCVSSDETTVLVARSQRPGLPMAGSFLLLLTNRRLVVTRESRLLHRVQLHLAAELRDVSNVVWSADQRSGAELALTVTDGVRERFWIPTRDPRRVRHLDALFSHVFRSRTVAAGTAPRRAARRDATRLSPAGAV